MADVEDLVSSEKKTNTKRKANAWCSAVNCSNSDSSNPEISFFRFPSDPERLCANHFEDVMFLNFQKNRLKPDAKPTLFDIPNPPAKIGPKRRKLQRTDDPRTRHGKKIKLDDSGSATCTSVEGQDINTDKSSHVANDTNDVHSSFDPEESQEYQVGSKLTASIQTPQYLSNNTPRKKRKQKVINSQNKKIKRLKKTISKLSYGKKAREMKALEDALQKLPKHLANFIRMQMKLHSRKKHGRRYSSEMKSIAISLYHASGKAYRLLSKLFILPDKSSIHRYISKLPSSTGISQAALKIIEKKVKQMSPKDRLCTLCMDEVSLKTHLFYSIKSDKIIGLEDFSLYRTNKVATSALVLLLRSICGKWKQPIGYYLVNGGCPSDVLETLIKGAIDKVESIGLNVVVVMSDMGSNFHSLALRLNVTPEQPWFMHNNKKYFLMFDPPHLIKCVRNNLMKYCFRFGQYVATWKDIEDFYMKDSALPIRSAPKLTEKHIHPTNFNKMRVKLATQILSHTVAASICMYVSLGGLPSTAMGTAEFLLKFDSVFDCVNCSTLHSTKKLKCPLNDKSPNKEFMKEAINFIKGLKVFDGNKECTETTKKSKSVLATTPQPQTLAIGPTDYKDPSVVSNMVKENTITYVAGYLLHKCSQKHSCSTCKEAQESNDLDDNKTLLCYFKAYDQDKSQFGGLHVPSASFLEYIIQLEAIFFKNFSIYTKSSSVGGSLSEERKKTDQLCLEQN
ncbi:Transposable element P transposase [Paramuricea clavata]|uniref:Transposable element P transposase n=1 Tax=Paramuricea clavata TaxID=317549 RepID=A0A6S7I3S5_PARCT|nr:Transposable element P transposase [Paramuricea clavata]